MQNHLQTIVTRYRVPLPSSDTSPTDFDLIAALLPPSAPASTAVSDEDDDEDERRTATLLLLRVAYAQAQGQLASITQELELLRGAPPAPSLHQSGTSDRARSSREAERASWTLDAPRSMSTAQRGGPLLDSAGKVCRQCGALLWAFLLMRMYVCSHCSHS
jgi:immunoglobulin-binding protein 1